MQLAAERWQQSRHNRHPGAEAARKARRHRRVRRAFNRLLLARVRGWEVKAAW
jgi:hypothetical protein